MQTYFFLAVFVCLVFWIVLLFFIQEYQSFTDLQFSKDKIITCIQWHPVIKGVVATAVAEKLTYDERIDQAAKIIMTPSLILIWSFTDPIHPQVSHVMHFDVFICGCNRSFIEHLWCAINVCWQYDWCSSLLLFMCSIENQSVFCSSKDIFNTLFHYIWSDFYV